MSSGRRLRWAEAMPVATRLVELLADACERIEIAGSLRRRVGEVGDIELVAAPRYEAAPDGFFGVEQVDLLTMRLARLMVDQVLVPRDVEVHRADGSIEVQRRIGDRYQALTFEALPVDLFIVRPPADWGVVLTIRTGPADWSERLVTEIKRRRLAVTQGHLVDTLTGERKPCPEERDFFAWIGQPWLDPVDRRADRVVIP